jgi:hypothetical protein
MSRIKRKTWIAVIQANCSHGYACGMTVSSEILTSIQSSTTSSYSPVEEQFLAKARILRKLAKYCAVIINFKPDTASLPFVQGLCSDLDNTKDSFEDTSEELTIISLGAQLCLYAVYLDQGRKRLPSAPDMPFDKKKATSRYDSITFAYMIAAKLIHYFSEMVHHDASADGSQDIMIPPQRHLPKHYFALVLLSMAFIFRTKLLHRSDTKALPSDPATHLSEAYQVLTTWSRDPLDEFGRAARVLSIMHQAEAQGQLEIQESKGEARPGVAFLDEIVSTAKGIRERKGELYPCELAPTSSHEPNIDLLMGGGIADHQFDLLEDPSLQWNLPWGLDLLSTDQYNFDPNVYTGFV